MQELEQIEKWRTTILECHEKCYALWDPNLLNEQTRTAESAARLFAATYAKDLLANGFPRQNGYFWDDMEIVLERIQEITSKATVIAKTPYEQEANNTINLLETSLHTDSSDDILTSLNSMHRRLDGLKNNGKIGKRIGPDEQKKIYDIWKTWKKDISCRGRKTKKEDVWKNETAQRKLKNLGVKNLKEFENAINAHEKTLASVKLKDTQSRG